jgi:hypothetical protein
LTLDDDDDEWLSSYFVVFRNAWILHESFDVVHDDVAVVVVTAVAAVVTEEQRHHQIMSY